MYEVIDYTKLRHVIKDRITKLEDLKFDAEYSLYMCRAGYMFMLLAVPVLLAPTGKYTVGVAICALCCSALFWYFGEVFVREYVCLYTAQLKYLNEAVMSPIFDADKVQDLLSYCTFEDKVKYIQILYEVVEFHTSPLFFRIKYVNYKGECFVVRAEVRSGKYKNGVFVRKHSDYVKLNALHLY